LYLAQIFRVQAQLSRLLPLSGEQGDVLAQVLLPFAGAERLAQNRRGSDRGGGLRGGLAADDWRKRCRWAGGRRLACQVLLLSGNGYGGRQRGVSG
jgi:hypothetical protein